MKRSLAPYITFWAISLGKTQPNRACTRFVPFPTTIRRFAMKTQWW